ncbi:DUF4907 domain-containing protein [Prolixibacter denitrificans]|jgi:hypothetical protein|uniref:Uncharacterized protein DUF4907 n=1 Tax=Prolixibacter denitrificans TaxID=1541063 RepID=A0A2P8CDQ3_9BACT|nr:DUF4907 domain-containing protein [Prolixibacter denitrificans]PSK83090.1 uncharacterized protein DUF4907 [Prolixibacter denitrificans]GET22026.1 hypothetical protein JCM18694_22720 [Prolixibacter denitrificans]
MTKRKTVIISEILIGLLIGILFFIGVQKHGAKRGFAVQVVRYHNEWGYLVKHNGQPFIEQTYYPGLSGKVAFQSKEAAQKVGQLVKEKLEKGKLPSVHLNELDSLHVLPKSFHQPPPGFKAQ